jgi:hypothetical protein
LDPRSALSLAFYWVVPVVLLVSATLASRTMTDRMVGGAGVPLTGDESRESWPASYKVRERR